jgi:hypothetical protein
LRPPRSQTELTRNATDEAARLKVGRQQARLVAHRFEAFERGFLIRPLPLLASYPHAEGHTRQAQAGAGPRTVATAEGVCAAMSNGNQKAAGWAVEARPQLTNYVEVTAKRDVSTQGTDMIGSDPLGAKGENRFQEICEDAGLIYLGGRSKALSAIGHVRAGR